MPTAPSSTRCAVLHDVLPAVMRTGRLPPRTWIVPHDLRADELAGSDASSDAASTTASSAFLWATPNLLIGARRAEPWRGTKIP